MPLTITFHVFGMTVTVKVKWDSLHDILTGLVKLFQPVGLSYLNHLSTILLSFDSKINTIIR